MCGARAHLGAFSDLLKEHNALRFKSSKRLNFFRGPVKHRQIFVETKPTFNPLQKLPLSLAPRKEMSARETAALGGGDSSDVHGGAPTASRQEVSSASGRSSPMQVEDLIY